VFHDLARRKECRIEDGHLMPDHVHMLISIPPKYSVAQIIGYMKGKSSIWIAQNVERKMRNFLGHKFWARGYFVTTVGRDEEVIRAYIRNQELADRQLEQFELKDFSSPKSKQSSKHPLKPPSAVPDQTSSFAGGYWLVVIFSTGIAAGLIGETASARLCGPARQQPLPGLECGASSEFSNRILHARDCCCVKLIAYFCI
jgi:putative transposase